MQGLESFCLTPSALTAPWVLFEAGAIAKFEKTHVCTLLIDLKHQDVTDPLAQFHHTDVMKKVELFQLVETLNNQLGEDKRSAEHIRRSFDKWWPDLDEQLKNLPSDDVAKLPHRSDRELLNDLVTLTRQTSLSVLESHREIMNMFKYLEFLQTRGQVFDYASFSKPRSGSSSPAAAGSSPSHGVPVYGGPC